jgi:predicted  nucleic acid-binding Zn-ribbon protein
MSEDTKTMLSEFETIMQALTEKNETIKANVAQKSQFGKQLLDNLTNINNKILDLVSKIKALKYQLNVSSEQVGTNEKLINGHNSQIETLKQEITRLESAKNAAEQQLSELQQKNIEEKNELQANISDCQSQLASLKIENDNIKTESNSIKATLENANQSQREIANQIEEIQKKSLEELNGRQLELDKKKQELINKQTELENNNAKILELNQTIQESKSRIQDLESQLKNKDAEVNRHIENTNNQQSASQQQITELNAKIEQLSNENEDLIKRIISAKNIMQEVFKTLNEITTNNLPEEDVNALITKINDSIVVISNLLAGSTGDNGSNNGSNSSSQNVPQNVDDAIKQLSGFDNMILLTNKEGTSYVTLTHENAITLLEKLTQNVIGKEKGIAVGVLDYLKNKPLGIDQFKHMNETYIKNFYYDETAGELKFRNVIQGGKLRKISKTKKLRKSKKSRKTKKLRKQRGGFVYNKRTQRRKITTLSTPASSRRHSATSRRSSSKRSSTKSQ